MVSSLERRVQNKARLTPRRFRNYHPEKVPSAVERYANEVLRVTMVLNNVLEGKQWLVGDKCTYADLSFIHWAKGAPLLLGDKQVDFKKEYPNYDAWLQRMIERPAVKRMLEEQEKAKAAA